MARLTAKTRNTLPAKSFAGPDRSYPINDMSHARNALSRVSQNGSPDLKAKVRAAVHRKYPGIKQHDDGPRPEMHGGPVKNRADRSPRHP